VKTRIFTSILLLALMIVSLILYASPIVNAQGEFSVSPESFTVTDVPPLGTPYTIPQNLVVWNYDTNARQVYVTAEIPPANEVTPGYEPIPNADWVIPSIASILIEENSFAVIQIRLNIPRQENLTGQKWEVWIPVERQALPGEIGILRPTVRMMIETTTTLPPRAKSATSLTISEENFTLQPGESKYLTVTLTSDGNPVEGETIIWSATAGTIAPSGGTTNTAGQVSVVYTAPSHENLVFVRAIHVGSEQYESSSAGSVGRITAPTPAPSSGIPTGVIIGIAIVIGCVVIAAAIVLVGRRR
jgi:hypothetical protein